MTRHISLAREHSLEYYVGTEPHMLDVVDTVKARAEIELGISDFLDRIEWANEAESRIPRDISAIAANRIRIQSHEGITALQSLREQLDFLEKRGKFA